MEKRIGVFAVTFFSMVIISCFKQGIEIPGKIETTPEKNSANIFLSPHINPAPVNIQQWVQFRGGLIYQRSKVSGAISLPDTSARISDRSGIPKRLITLTAKMA